MKLRLLLPGLVACTALAGSAMMQADYGKQNTAPTSQNRVATHMYPYSKNPDEASSQIARDFEALQEQYGVSTPAREKWTRHKSGHRVAESDINAVRERLNQLLMTGGSPEKFSAKVDKLERMKPAQWPRAEDYRKLWDAMHPQRQEGVHKQQMMR